MDVPAEVVAAILVLREGWPHVMKWAPRLRDFVAGRSAAASAAVVSDAQAAQLRAQAHVLDVQADAKASAVWARLNASTIARLEKVEKAEQECQDRAARLERDWEAREKMLRAEALKMGQELRQEMVEAVRRVQARATPRPGYTTLADPMETPKEGNRLSAPALPSLEIEDPTPDLQVSVTPSRAKTDPPR